jgi:SRSO17 transposase
MDETWKSDLERWVALFLGALRHKARARMCPVYVAGLIGAGDRKSMQPMAACDGDVGYDQLHHFIVSGVWDAVPIEKALLVEADRMVGGADAWLIVDDTALPKKGAYSVCVAPQYASSLGKTANCQSLVSLTLASREVPVMVSLRNAVCPLLRLRWLALRCASEGCSVVRADPQRRRASHGAVYRNFRWDRRFAGA